MLRAHSATKSSAFETDLVVEMRFHKINPSYGLDLRHLQSLDPERRLFTPESISHFQQSLVCFSRTFLLCSTHLSYHPFKYIFIHNITSHLNDGG